MDFETILKNRRSIRDFQNKEVPLPILKEIIQDTCLAPTASNGQPCRFIIIQNRDCIKKLSNESKKSLLDDLDRNPNLPLKQYEAALRDERFNVFYNAPCLVLFVGPKDVYSLDVDCGLTVAYFMFSATSRGLGTCWIGLGAHVRDKKILDEIGVPSGCRIVAPIIIGYPESIPAASERHSPDILKSI
ncbi:MAG: nitroreductase family protein [Proteobacteria bacterium]|nr:nitroreductase family protein [Pseudomonadota bacterium]MBU1964788.1 nitroreductase family protein [Pseudomonadota bacterium]MBU4372788.1 nitroreductase family protein [Pseudomonadota bacterium]MBU4583468.1 nitroreductase family protein [Pseudomonadota bacterium]